MAEVPDTIDEGETTLMEEPAEVDIGSSTPEGDEIRETDIVFECPHCTKSLAIDYRGAGLTILCSDCGQSVQVPIPEGMEISDLDVSEEDQERIILQLRKALTEVHEKLEVITAENNDLRSRRDILDKMHTRDLGKFELIQRELENVRRVVDQLNSSVTYISENLRSGS